MEGKQGERKREKKREGESAEITEESLRSQEKLSGDLFERDKEKGRKREKERKGRHTSYNKLIDQSREKEATEERFPC